MCTTIGFKYNKGFVFGRTLEIGIKTENNLLYVPANEKDFIQGIDAKYDTKYATLGSAFYNIPSFGDGFNECGLMGSNNFFPGYGSFSEVFVDGKINTTMSHAFDFLLTRCKDIKEVKEAVENLNIVTNIPETEETSMSNHFFFMDQNGHTIVLEPKEGKLVLFDNSYGVLTNAPDFDWHTTNLKNYVNLKKENIESSNFNETVVSKLGEGTGMLGIPGDFTPSSRFVRAAYFVSNTDKDLDRKHAILQGFRILSQFDIPSGAIVDGVEKHEDEKLYTALMDSDSRTYFIKYHDNINLQVHSMDDFKDTNALTFIQLEKEMRL